MKLSDRLKVAQEERRESAGGPLPRTVPGAPAADGFVEYKRRTREALLSKLGPRVFDASLSAAQLHRLIVGELEHLIAEERAPLSDADRKSTRLNSSH